MKYLRPELHVQLNSADEGLADQAEEKIEQASEACRRHWAAIKPHMPASVVKFCEEQLLHDADVLGPAKLDGAPLRPGSGDVVIVAQQVNTLDAAHLNTLIFLHYVTTAEPEVAVPVPSRVFRHDPAPHWIWDEFDLVEPGFFTHSILLSDGRVVTIRFRDFHYHLAQNIIQNAGKSPTAIPSGKAPPANGVAKCGEIDLRVLYGILAEAAKAGGQLTYQELSEAYRQRTGELHPYHGTWDDPLGELNRMLDAADLPPLSAVVVLKKEREPGGKFWGSCPRIPNRPSNPDKRLLEYSRILRDVHKEHWPDSLPWNGT